MTSGKGCYQLSQRLLGSLMLGYEFDLHLLLSNSLQDQFKAWDGERRNTGNMSVSLWKENK